MHAETLLDIAMMHADSLIENAQQGDERSLNRLVSLWYKRIYNYSFKYVSEHDLAAEIAQKTFISMFRNVRKLKDPDSFKPWLYRIATNLCHEEARKQKRNKTISYSGEDADKTEQVVMHVQDSKERFYDPERSYQQKELEKALLEAMSEISEEHRSVVIMKEYEGFKFREIAEVIGVSENTVKTRLYAGLKNLKEILKKNNITRETVHYEL